MKKIFLVAMLFVSLGICAQNKATDKILKEGLENNQTMDHLDILCNRFGGRLIGSDAYDNAADWVEYMFKKAGAKVERQICGELPVGFNRGPWFGRALGLNGVSSLRFTTPSYTAGTKGVQRGHVLKEPLSTREFEKMKGSIKGAWILIGGKNSGWPIDYSATGDSLRALDIKHNDSLLTAKGPWADRAKQMKTTPALFYREMIEAGALGFIQSAACPITTLYDRKNLHKMTWETLPTTPDIKLDEQQYEIIAKAVERKEYFQLEFDIRNHFKMGPVPYDNVIAIFEGSKYPDECVIIGGHLDAFDVATGGVDCGTGSAVAIEVARIIGTLKEQPKRTIICAIWCGEEFGLYGSRYFVENYKGDLNKISNYINRDGGPTLPTGATVPEAMYEDWVKAAAPLKGHFDFDVKVGKGFPIDKPKRAGGSDHAYFAMNGVPTISMDQGEPTGSNFDYREIWHTEHDLYNKAIPSNMEGASTITAILTWYFANTPKILDRTGYYKE